MTPYPRSWCSFISNNIGDRQIAATARPLDLAVPPTTWRRLPLSRERSRRVRRVELTPKSRALITRGFGEHAAAMEDVARVLSKNERLTLLRFLKKLGKHAAETHK